MSRRTAESNKAILAAWNKEQELVQDGKGTREWTQKQQQDILDKGKAYDDDGIAFQGQHMKSAEKYPEYQGKPDNIQFLTRAEHLEAHGGNWRNPTNWYFNPVTNEKIDFGDGKYIPCPVIKLTEPIVIINSSQEKVIDVAEKEAENTIFEKMETPLETTKKLAKPPERVGFGKKVKSALKICADAVIEFQAKHPTAIKVIKWIGIAAVTTYTAVESTKDKSSNSNGDSYEPNNTLGDDYLADSDDTATFEHASPEEHTVRGHGQHYHTKDGVIWKEKEPFSRGGKKNE